MSTRPWELQISCDNLTVHSTNIGNGPEQRGAASQSSNRCAACLTKIARTIIQPPLVQGTAWFKLNRMVWSQLLLPQDFPTTAFYITHQERILDKIKKSLFCFLSVICWKANEKARYTCGKWWEWWPPGNKQLEPQRKEACCLDGPLCHDEEGEPSGPHTGRAAQVTATWLWLGFP